MRKTYFNLIIALLFCLTGTVSGSALKLIPVSADYLLSFDLKRIAALPAAKEAMGETQNSIAEALSAVGCTRINLTGGSKWAVVLVDFSCSREALLTLLAGNGVSAAEMDIQGRTFYRLDHWKLGNASRLEKPVLTFVAPKTAALMEQKKASAVLAAMKQVRTVNPGKEILWCNVVPGQVSAPDIPQLGEVMRIFRNFRTLTLKIDLTGSAQDTLMLALAADCKNADSANLAAFMLPAGMILGINYLCSSDVELCNQLAGMVVPGVSGTTAWVRLALPPELLRRVTEAVRKKNQNNLETPAAQRK